MKLRRCGSISRGNETEEDRAHREHHESLCRWTRPARHFGLVAEDRNERRDHAQHGARNGNETADPRDTVKPREGHERY